MRCNVGVGRKLKVLHTRQFHQNGHHHTCRETAGVKAKYFFHFSQLRPAMNFSLVIYPETDIVSPTFTDLSPDRSARANA